MIAASIFDLPELITDREILEILAQSQAIRLEELFPPVKPLPSVNGTINLSLNG